MLSPRASYMPPPQHASMSWSGGMLPHFLDKQQWSGLLNFFSSGFVGQVWRMSETLGVCVHNKASSTRPVGLLHLLPISSCTESHVFLDFLMSILMSRGNMVINMVSVYQFSRAKFLALLNLPSTKKIAKLILHAQGGMHCKAFCQLIGASVASFEWPRDLGCP